MASNAVPATQATARTLDELVGLATHLADADERMLFALIKARKDAEMSQRDVAEFLGIKQSSVASFESHDNDPKLSTIRRYALAVGATVEHRVSCPGWTGPGWVDATPGMTYSVGSYQASEQIKMAAPRGSLRTDFDIAA